MRVLITTGSSGGHIFPALALANALKDLQQQVLLVLPQDKEESKIPVNFSSLAYMRAARVTLRLNKENLQGMGRLFLGFREALSIIIKFKPEVVVGFGSLNSLSLVFLAWLFRIKTMIHEQNVVPGQANKLLAKLVDKVAISFSQTRNYLQVAADKIVTTGNCLRPELVLVEKKIALDFFKFNETKFTIFITGGSQGAHKLNLVAQEALMALVLTYDLQLIHICGAADFEYLDQRYAASGLSYKLFDFFGPMQYAYSAADLVICRAGATTIAELQKFKVPAILVPYPFAGAHQLVNAQVLSQLGAAEIIPDAQLNAQGLNQKLRDYFSQPQKLKARELAYQKIQVVDAVSLLAQEVLNLNSC